MKFYTFKKQVPLKPGEKIGYQRGKGYYVIAAPKPKPPPNVYQSPFAGVGAFTAWDPAAAIGLHKASWVVIQLDAEGGHTASASQLRQAGYKHVFGWQARADLQGVLDCRNQGLDGYIGQAESQAELDKCLGLGKIAGLPHALVGNPTAWTDQGHAQAKDAGWELIIECYTNVQPWLTPDKLDSRGYPITNVLYGCYDGSSESPKYGKRISVSEYRAMPPAYPNWSVYLAETLTAEDRAFLA